MTTQRPVKHLWLIALLTMLTLSGCSSLFESEADRKLKPVELEKIASNLPIRVLWKKSIGDLGKGGAHLKLVPAFAGNLLFTADASGKVEAHDALTGKGVWKNDTKLAISGGPGVGEGLVLVGTHDAELLALDERSGAERWRTRLSSEVLSVPRADRGVVVVYTVDGRLHGLSAADGRSMWIYDRPTPALTLYGSSSPVVDAGRVICGFANGKLAALNLITGEPLWETSITLPSGRTDLERMVDINGDPVVKDGVVFVASFQGDLAAVSADSGSVFWRKQLSSHAGVAVNWRMVYASDSANTLWAVDPRSGSAVWRNSGFGNRRISAPAVLGDYLLIGDLEGYIHWVSQEDGRVVGRNRVGDDPISSAPLVRGKVAFVLGNGGDLAALTLEPAAPSSE